MVSIIYFFLIIIICLHTVIWFQPTNNNNPLLAIIESYNYFEYKQISLLYSIKYS